MSVPIKTDHLASAILQEITEGVTLTDDRGTILEINDAFSAITGYSSAEAIGQNPRILKSHHHDDQFYLSMWEDIRSSGRWAGEIWNRRKDGEVYPEWLCIRKIPGTDGRDYFLAVFSDLSRMKSRLEGRTLHRSQDPLTGLADRFVLMERIALSVDQARKSDTSVGLLVVNLDRFKDVNDGLGYLAGDRVLREVAVRLRDLAEDNELVARVGSDEFALVVPHEKGSGRVNLLVRSICHLFRHPISVGDIKVDLSASVGISNYPEDASDGDGLIRNAGLALHRVKREALRGGYALFTEEMDLEARRRSSLEQDILSAMEKGEFFLQYQPQVTMGGRSVVGVEALLRWRRQGGEIVPPNEFIPLAEETGTMARLGRWILKESCSQGEAWRKAGYDLKLSVNISPVQIYGDDLFQSVQSTLKETGFPSERLVLEITENTLRDDRGRLSSVFRSLRDLGVKVAIDDFGTGYSSFDFIRNFTFDTLKIDRSFVLDLERSARNAAVADSIIQMARNLVKDVVIEGVETEAQIGRIGKERHDLVIQGFFYSRPLDPDMVPHYIESIRRQEAL
nr:EAL domain-containing protein [uncultured Dethiosulfovibrio sp.]